MMGACTFHESVLKITGGRRIPKIWCLIANLRCTPSQKSWVGSSDYGLRQVLR